MQRRQHFFQRLVRAYSNDLYRMAYWLAKDRDIAEDLVQETFARAWKAIDSLNDEQAAKAWLITILRRENARRFEKIQVEWVEIEESLVADDLSNEPTEKLEKQQLYQAIMKLEPEFKEPLILQVIWGFSGEEIAQQMELKLATVNTRLYRARQQLKQVFDVSEKNLKQGGTK